MNKKNKIIIGSVVAATIIVGLLVLGSVILSQQRKLDKLTTNAEVTCSNLISSSLEEYYASEGLYPQNLDFLQKFTTSVKHVSKESQNTSNLDCKDTWFKEGKYSVNDIKQSYKFTYKNHNGEAITFDGIHNKDEQ